MAGNIGAGASKRRRIRYFQNAWLDEDIFKTWLAPSPVINKAYCVVCNKTITCCKVALINHTQTVRHMQKMASLDSKPVIVINDGNNLNNTTLSHKDKVKRAEIKLSAFFAEHNIAFSTVDHLIPLIQDVCKESHIVQDLSLARHKCAKIVKNVIAKREVEQIVGYLKTCRFSILLEETTDISDSKVMCVLVKFVSPVNKKVTTQLLDLLPLHSTDSSASSMYEILKKFLLESEIPLKNIVGIACDNLSVNNYFETHLREEVPDLITFKCLCHTSAMIASKSYEKLPPSCENLIKLIASYTSGSVKTCTILVEFQEFFEAQHNKISKLSITNWLCLHKCIIKLLENWDSFQNFFASEVVEDKLKSAEIILDYLNDTSVKAYMYFLKYALNFFDSFNALFQSRKILIHKLFDNSRQLIRQIGQNFVQHEALKDVTNLDLSDASNILKIRNIYVGPECECFLESLKPTCAQQIRSKCLAFYITAVREMIARLSLHDTCLQDLVFLDPKVALYNEGRLKIKDLSEIAKRVNIENVTQLAFEWRILPSYFDEEQKENLASLDVDEMWCNILKLTNFDGEEIFQTLKLLVEIVLSLPHSNYEAKRIFSIVTDVKTKIRNSLTDDTVSSISVVKSCFKSKNITCSNFEVDRRHFELHNAQNLYKDGPCDSN